MTVRTVPVGAAARKANRRWGRVAALGMLAAIGAAMVFLRSTAPTGIGWAPPCPFLRATGLHCPGCGSVRATHHLLNGRVRDAWRHNPAMVALGAPVGAILIAGLLMTGASGRRLDARFVPWWAGWAALGTITLFGIARNFPDKAFEALRPPAPSVPLTGG